jgi:hypothetical protein
MHFEVLFSVEEWIVGGAGAHHVYSRVGSMMLTMAEDPAFYSPMFYLHVSNHHQMVRPALAKRIRPIIKKLLNKECIELLQVFFSNHFRIVFLSSVL